MAEAGPDSGADGTRALRGWWSGSADAAFGHTQAPRVIDNVLE